MSFLIKSACQDKKKKKESVPFIREKGKEEEVAEEV